MYTGMIQLQYCSIVEASYSTTSETLLYCTVPSTVVTENTLDSLSLTIIFWTPLSASANVPSFLQYFTVVTRNTVLRRLVSLKVFDDAVERVRECPINSMY